MESSGARPDPARNGSSSPRPKPTGATEDLRPGTRVDVRSRYVGTWSHGFEVAERVSGNGYRVRRISDGSVLREPLALDEVRPERRKQGLWWT